MATQLIQAAQQALDAFEAFGEVDDFATLFTLTQKMNALRTAIQQAEAKTDEPFAWVEHHKGGDNLVWDEPGGRKSPLYTHPAPGVPDDVARDVERYRWLRKWKGQEHEPPFTVQHEFYGTLWGGDLDSAIDAAMLAASPAQKGGE